MNPHILSEFDEALQDLKTAVIEMASNTRHNLERAMQALFKRDAEMSRAVVAGDAAVDDAEKEIDRMGMDLLTRFRPVASDLRMVVSSIKVAINLERISDHAVNIAKRARKMAKHPELPELHIVEPLYGMADHLLKDALVAFIDGHGELGASLRERDRDLNRQHKRVVGALGTRLEDGEGHRDDYLHLILIARSIERVGDLAVNIGEDAVFLESAEDIRYMPRAKGTAAPSSPLPPPSPQPTPEA